MAADAPAQEVFDPPPVPEVYRAFAAQGPIAVDGVLEEPSWQAAAPITGFVQKDPVQEAPASYRTHVRVLYDDEALYIGAICYQPADATRVQTLRRDFSREENDLFGVSIDGFLDQRNTVAFQTTPLGNQRDLEVIDGLEVNVNWDARWSVRTRLSETHWSAEFAIPWRTLRYPRGADRIGVIFARNVRSLNEQTSAPAVPRAFSVHRMAYEGELHGILPPPPGANVQLKPYFAVNRLSESGRDADTNVEGGGEAKWALTPSTVLDLTVNTDFAQADADRQVINLDRFSVFFPERRQFFLESANIFSASVTEWIRPFFSRRIGLDDRGSPIPLDGGLRLTSRTTRHQLGILALRQRAFASGPAADFVVARYSRNLSGQSRLGGMLTYRRDDADDNATYTLDGLWRPSQSVGIQGMLSLSEDSQTGSGLGGQLWAFYQNNRVYLSSLQYYSKDYNPGVGLELLDTNYMMHNLTASVDLRSKKLPRSVRSVNPGISAFIFRSADDGDLLFGYAPLRPLRLRFASGAQVDAYVEPNWQRLTEAFSPAGIRVAPGDYNYTRYRIGARTDQSARLSASASLESGDYFDGELTSLSVAARAVPLPQIELSADVQINRLRDLGVSAEDADARLYGLEVRFAPTPRLSVSGYYQWDTLAERSVWNFRLAWEYRPLSYVHLVYNMNEREGLGPADRFTQDQFIAKVTYLFEI